MRSHRTVRFGLIDHCMGHDEPHRSSDRSLICFECGGVENRREAATVPTQQQSLYVAQPGLTNIEMREPFMGRHYQWNSLVPSSDSYRTPDPWRLQVNEVKLIA